MKRILVTWLPALSIAGVVIWLSDRRKKNAARSFDTHWDTAPVNLGDRDRLIP